MIALDLQPVAAGADGPRQKIKKKKIINNNKKEIISPAHSLAPQTGPDSGQERRSKAFTCLPSSGLGKGCRRAALQRSLARSQEGEENLCDLGKTGLFGESSAHRCFAMESKAGGWTRTSQSILLIRAQLRR